MSELFLEIVTPERAFYEGEVDRVIVRGTEGDIGILKNRSPIATPLKIGKVRIFKDGKEEVAAVAEGYITVIDNKVTIVTDAAEWPHEIDEQRAKQALDRAEKRLESQGRSEDIDLVRAEAALKRALNRLDVIKHK